MRDIVLNTSIMKQYICVGENICRCIECAYDVNEKKIKRKPVEKIEWNKMLIIWTFDCLSYSFNFKIIF